LRLSDYFLRGPARHAARTPFRVITRSFPSTGSNSVLEVPTATDRECFEIARTRARKKVTAAHKEPVYRLACGMFAEECRKVARDYPDVSFEEMMIVSVA
jgi:hypothetical protein